MNNGYSNSSVPPHYDGGLNGLENGMDQEGDEVEEKTNGNPKARKPGGRIVGSMEIQQIGGGAQNHKSHKWREIWEQRKKLQQNQLHTSNKRRVG